VLGGVVARDAVLDLALDVEQQRGGADAEQVGPVN